MVSWQEFKDLLIRSTLSERRPIDDDTVLKSMVENANLMVCARHQGQLVGIGRCVTDFSYCCYLSDLAVDNVFQRRGIGKQIIEEIQRHIGAKCKLILLSAPNAVGYYPQLGFLPHPTAFIKHNE